MTAIESLRALEAQATPGPWMFDNAEGHLPDIYTDHGGKWNVATTNALRDDHVNDARLIATLRNLAGPFLDLWEMARKESDDHNGYGQTCHCNLCESVYALDARAGEVIRG